MGYAAIHIREFPIIAWLRSDPALHLKALAVVEGRPPLQRIVSLSKIAELQGVSTCHSKAQAEATGSILFRDRSTAEEQAALEDVCQVVEQFSPRLQIITGPPDDITVSLLVDQAGTETLFGSAENYGKKLYAELAHAGFPCSVAVSANAQASLMFALHYAGPTFIQAENTAKRLASLPVSLLRCESSVLRVLSRWGVRTLGELAELPAASLVSRIGQQAQRLQRLALGVEDHLLIPLEKTFNLSEHQVLETSIDQLESLLFLVSPMLETVMRRAMERGYALRTVTLTLQLDQADSWRRQIRPALPTQNRELLLKLIDLELQVHLPKAAILGIMLSAEPVKAQTAQRGLFQAQFPEPDKLDLLIGRLRSIAGDANVGSPTLCNSHQEDDFSNNPFCPYKFAPEQDLSVEPVRTALRRFRPPQPTRITIMNGTPSLLFWQGQLLKITAVKGPWQSSGCWWNSRKWAFEEWDAVVTMPVQALRVRHEVISGTWMVVGVYD